MSVLDVYLVKYLQSDVQGAGQAHLERADALRTASPPRAIADSSTYDDELTMPRAKARSVSWNWQN